MPAMAGTLYLGTSGFGYDEWRHGVFYPEGLPASRMLSHYATLFRSVEINYTFRKFPSQKVLTSWLQQTPEGFRFTLKANQRITHVRRLRDVAGEVRAFMNEATVLGDRLGPVLFQCPPTVEYDEPLLAAFADGLPPGIAAVMEFRHPSWRAAWPFLAERRHRPLCCRHRRRGCRRGRAGLAAVRVPAPATRDLQRLRAGACGRGGSRRRWTTAATSTATSSTRTRPPGRGWPGGSSS